MRSALTSSLLFALNSLDFLLAAVFLWRVPLVTALSIMMQADLIIGSM